MPGTFLTKRLAPGDSHEEHFRSCLCTHPHIRRSYGPFSYGKNRVLGEERYAQDQLRRTSDADVLAQQRQLLRNAVIHLSSYTEVLVDMHLAG